MEIIDFHSHLLPGIDDGSKNIETSIKIIQSSLEQGVDSIIATPHFYASRDRVGDFLKRRDTSYHHLIKKCPYKDIQIFLGAEVAFFPGIGRADKIEQLCVKGTNLILLEMPFRSWNSVEIEEVRQLVEDRNLRVVLAHLERYMRIGKNKERVKEILCLPVSVQVNAEGFLQWRQRRLLFNMLKEGIVDVLGSDCHGIDSRPPNLKAGRDIIAQKLGQSSLNRIDHVGRYILLGGKKKCREKQPLSGM